MQYSTVQSVQYNTVHCNTTALQHITTLQYIAFLYITLHYFAHYITIAHYIVHYITIALHTLI